MREAFIIFKLRLKLIVRKPGLIILMLLMPIAFYAFSLEMLTKSIKDDQIPIAVVDEDNTASSKLISDALNNNKLLKCSFLTRSKALDLLRSENVQGVYVLKKDLEIRLKVADFKELIQVYYLRNNNLAPVITEIISSELIFQASAAEAAEFTSESYKSNGVTLENLKEKVYNSIISKMALDSKNIIVNVNITHSSKLVSETTETIFGTRWILNIYMIFVSVFLVFNCSSLINERKRKLKNRIVVTGCGYLKIFSAELSAFIFMGSLLYTLQLVLMLVFGELNFQSAISDLFISVCYLFVISNLLMLVSRIFKNTVSFQSFVTLMILFIGLLGGCFFSIELMPEEVRKIAILTPTFWAQNMVNGSSVAVCATVLLIYGVGIMLVNLAVEK